MAVASATRLALLGALAVLGACESAPADVAPPAPTPAPGVRVSPPIARLVRVDGDVRVKRAGSTQWIPVDRGAELGAEDSVQAMDSGSAEIVMLASGATVRLRPATTLQVPRPASDPLRVTGRMVVRVSATTDPAELRLRLPPGVLVLRAEPQRQPVVEATVDVSELRSAVEMVEGTATVTPAAGTAIPLGRGEWARFRADGSLEQAGVAGPVATLVTPLDDETVRTAGLVDLRWEALDGTDGYSIEITSQGASHRLESRQPSIKTRFTTGDYRWTVQGRHAGVAWPAAAPRVLHVEVDDRPPALVVTEPPDHATVTGPRVQFAGKSEPAAIIEIGTQRGKADGSGRFSIDVRIARGLSNLVIRARDDLGNERRLSRSIVWE